MAISLFSNTIIRLCIIGRCVYDCICGDDFLRLVLYLCSIALKRAGNDTQSVDAAQQSIIFALSGCFLFTGISKTPRFIAQGRHWLAVGGGAQRIIVLALRHFRPRSRFIAMDSCQNNQQNSVRICQFGEWAISWSVRECRSFIGYKLVEEIVAVYILRMTEHGHEWQTLHPVTWVLFRSENCFYLTSSNRVF